MTALALDVRELSSAEISFVAGGNGPPRPPAPPPPPPRPPVHEVLVTTVVAGLVIKAMMTPLGMFAAVVFYPTPAHGNGSERNQ